MRRLKAAYRLLIAIILLSGCANMAQGPTGGEKDVIPPSFASSVPAQNAQNVKTKKIEILFSEYLQINNPTQNLIVSPPQRPAASAKVIGKKVVVELKDSLRPNTTYTLDFNNCIGDYTENNLIPNYCHTFSTGDTLDTLAISGILIDAKTLAPLSGITVGIYSQNAYTDTTFYTTPFERIGRTDPNGRFSIKGLKAHPYKLFALDDLNSNFFRDQPGEGVAILEGELPTPSVKETFTHDTIIKDSMKIDTIITRKELSFLPDSLRLRFFRKETKQQSLGDVKRTERKKFTLTFKKIDQSLPTVKIAEKDLSDWYILEANPTKDTLKYWITDTTLLHTDSLRLCIDYLKTDSAEKLVPKSDTMWVVLPQNYIKEEEKKAKAEEKKRKKQEERGIAIKRTNILNLATQQKNFEIDETPTLTWEYPVQEIKSNAVHLFQKKDTVITEIPVQLEKTENQRTFTINANITTGLQYTLSFDSAAVTDHYDNHNDSLAFCFSKKTEDEYNSITLKLQNLPKGLPAIVQLLSQKDEPIRTQKAETGVATFIHLTPATYYAKLFIDSNGNGIWDTGDLETLRQPEEVHYLPKALTLRKGWDMQEDWDINAVPLENQRPNELKAAEKKDQR